ncbi:MAG: radical SAM protein [Polyangiaceae bacterium]
MKALYRTTSLCATCKNALPAEVRQGDDGSVVMHKACPEHGEQTVQLSTDADWYMQTRATEPQLTAPRENCREVELGCPFDCGPCEHHEQEVRLPVVTITSACNLDCPICYVHNKNKDAYFMPVADFEQVLRHLKRAHGEVDIVNFTGGEPLLHPDFGQFLRLSREAGVHRVTICSNGIKLARDEALVKQLADAGARVALSFDTFDQAVDYELQGAKLIDLKLRCLELLEKHGVDTTLIPVMTKGLNDHEIGRILELALKLRCVRHVEVHTITFTGQGGTSFSRERRISMVEVLDQNRGDHGRLARAARLRAVTLRAPAVLPNRLSIARSRGRPAGAVHPLHVARNAVRLPVGAPVHRAVAQARARHVERYRRAVGERRRPR